ncbi:MAG TPA: hypothetical protein VI387_07340 [Candidatus Brocadiales bacterium]|nr:hypothetical protein [Candidatus Brocadiales bacterium]
MKRLGYLTVFLAFIILASNLYAETATIMGEIIHYDNSPAGNLVVSIEGKFSITDAKGRYLIKDIQSGLHTMQIKENRENGRILKEVKIEIKPPRLIHNETIP